MYIHLRTTHSKTQTNSHKMQHPGKTQELQRLQNIISIVRTNLKPLGPETWAWSWSKNEVAFQRSFHDYHVSQGMWLRPLMVQWWWLPSSWSDSSANIRSESSKIKVPTRARYTMSRCQNLAKILKLAFFREEIHWLTFGSSFHPFIRFSGRLGIPLRCSSAKRYGNEVGVSQLKCISCEYPHPWVLC